MIPQKKVTPTLFSMNPCPPPTQAQAQESPPKKHKNLLTIKRVEEGGLKEEEGGRRDLREKEGMGIKLERVSSTIQDCEKVSHCAAARE